MFLGDFYHFWLFFLCRYVSIFSKQLHCCQILWLQIPDKITIKDIRPFYFVKIWKRGQYCEIHLKYLQCYDQQSKLNRQIISIGAFMYLMQVAGSALVDLEDKDKIISMYISPSCYISKIEIKNSCTVAISSGYKYWTNYHKRHSVSLFCKSLKKRVKLTIVSSGAFVCPVLVALSVVVDMVDNYKFISM